MLVPKAREEENEKNTVSQTQNKQKHLKRKLKTPCIFGTYCMCTKSFLWEFTKYCSKFWIKYICPLKTTQKLNTDTHNECCTAAVSKME